MVDSELLAELTKSAQGYRDRVPVFHVLKPSVEESVQQARSVAALIWNEFMNCAMRPVIGPAIARMQLPHEGHVDVFEASGAIAATMRSTAARKPIVGDESKADRKGLAAVAQKMAATIAERYVATDDQLRFESTWEKKGQGVTTQGEKTPVALFEVLNAFRRYLHGLPVLGAASVYVSLGAGTEVTTWGIDWRRVRSTPFAHTAVVSPDEGAQRVLNDLWWKRPERPFSSKDFEVKSFSLGYLSHSRWHEQFVMQPAWVAVLAPRGSMSMGHVVAAAAAPQAFEPIERPTRMPRAAN